MNIEKGERERERVKEITSKERDRKQEDIYIERGKDMEYIERRERDGERDRGVESKTSGDMEKGERENKRGNI